MTAWQVPRLSEKVPTPEPRRAVTSVASDLNPRGFGSGNAPWFLPMPRILADPVDASSPPLLLLLSLLPLPPFWEEGNLKHCVRAWHGAVR